MIRYAVSEFEEMQKEKTYRIYVTDCLKTIAENVAKISGGSIMKSRYADIIQPVAKNENKKSAEEIITETARKAGSEFEIM